MRPNINILAGLVVCGFPLSSFAGPVTEDYPKAAITANIAGFAPVTTTGKYGEGQIFFVGSKGFAIDLEYFFPADRSNPHDVTDVKFDTVLATAFPKWSFNYSKADGSDLSLAAGTLVVQSYDVANPNPVEMDFYVKYTGADPAPGADLHWIQVIDTNWKLPHALYVEDNKVDNLGAAVPYYDDMGFASGSLGAPDKAFFLDKPSRDKADLAGYNGTPLYWYAEAYLVNETAANNAQGGRDVDVYDGVRWGWTVTRVAEPSSWLVLAAGCAGLLIVLRHRGRREYR